MFRWLVVCLLLAAGSFVVVAVLAPPIGTPAPAPVRGGSTPPRESKSSGSTDPEPVKVAAGHEKPAESSRERAEDAPVRLIDGGPARLSNVPPLIIQEARLLSTERQEVPSVRDGKLVCVATPILPGERVPPGKMVEVELGFLAIEPLPGELVAPNDRITFRENPGRIFRRATEKDSVQPERSVVVRQKTRLRKLEVGDRVVKDQLLAVVDPELGLEDLAIKVAKLDASEADRRASMKTKEEAVRRVENMARSRSRNRASVSDDDFYAGELAVQKYTEEESAKSSLARQAQREVAAAATTLKMHEIRAAIDGVVKVLYKQPGEAVKNLEQVLQIQNPNLLRVEGLAEVQEGLLLKRRLDLARERVREANRLLGDAEARNDAGAKEQARLRLNQAEDLTRVIVEASRPVPPLAVLRGHLNEVTSVAVSKGPRSLIVSASEDKTVRIWEQVPGHPRWHDRYQLDHPAVVRALACTAPTAKRNLLLTGTASGQGRLFDLDDLKAGESKLKDRHSQAITCVAFSPNGNLCATGGEDRAICLWDTNTLERLHRIAGAHVAGLTGLQFVNARQLLSTGRDKRMVVWDLADDGKSASQSDRFERRSGDVPVLEASPDGKQVLFDESRELRVLSLASHKIEGVLQNPPGAANFSTMARFSPDGKTILTNGPSAGRLQLWKAPSAGVRASELRQYVWNSAPVTCWAFTPDGNYAVTGTQDNQVLVWEMPGKAEVDVVLYAQLNYVEEFLDSSLKRVTIRAEMNKPDWVMPGGTATVVIPSQPLR